MTDERRAISHARRRRNGRGYRVTMAISQITELMTQNCDEVYLKFLESALDDWLRLAVEEHENLMSLLDDTDPDYNDIWISDHIFNVNMCHAKLCKYFENEDNPFYIPTRVKKEPLIEFTDPIADIKKRESVETECSPVDVTEDPSTASDDSLILESLPPLEPIADDLPRTEFESKEFRVDELFPDFVDSECKISTLFPKSNSCGENTSLKNDITNVGQRKSFPPIILPWYNGLERDTDNARELFEWLMFNTQGYDSQLEMFDC